MKPALAIAFTLFAAAAAAQTPAPAPQKAPAPANAAPAPANAAPAPANAAPASAAEPHKPLILRLDEIDGPKMSFGASQGETYQSNQLPDLGKPDRSWTPPERAVPKETGSDAY
jgi:3-oxoacyl-ACP reductase-like protein